MDHGNFKLDWTVGEVVNELNRSCAPYSSLCKYLNCSENELSKKVLEYFTKVTKYLLYYGIYDFGKVIVLEKDSNGKVLCKISVYEDSVVLDRSYGADGFRVTTPYSGNTYITVSEWAFDHYEQCSEQSLIGEALASFIQFFNKKQKTLENAYSVYDDWFDAIYGHNNYSLPQSHAKETYKKYSLLLFTKLYKNTGRTLKNVRGFMRGRPHSKDEFDLIVSAMSNYVWEDNASVQLKSDAGECARALEKRFHNTGKTFSAVIDSMLSDGFLVSAMLKSIFIVLGGCTLKDNCLVYTGNRRELTDFVFSTSAKPACSDTFKKKFYGTGKTLKVVVNELQAEGYSQQDIIKSILGVLADVTWDK